MKRLLIFLLLLSTFSIAKSQTAFIQDHQASSGSITIPVEVTEFENVAAISMYFEYDDEVLTFDSYQNAALPGLMANSFQVNGESRIGIAWSASGSTGYDVNGTLVEIVFEYQSGTSDLAFLESICEVVDNNYQNIPVVYTDGSVSPELTIPVELEDQFNMHTGQVMMPLNVDFSQIPDGAGSFTFMISYDSDVLDFDGLRNVALTNILVNELYSPNRIAIIWTNPSISGSYLNGKLLDLKFNYFGGNDELDFIESSCVISDNNLQELTGEYTNGFITEAGTMTTITLDSIGAEAGTEVLLPMTVERFENIGAFDFNINYQSNVIEFVELVNLHPNLDPSYLESNSEDGWLGINWMMTSSGCTIPDGEALFDLKFSYTDEETDLVFDESLCEISGENLNTVNAVYNDGKITPEIDFGTTIAIDSLVGSLYQDNPVPVMVTEFDNVGAFDLVIDFDPVALDFSQLENIHSQISDEGTLMYNSTGGTIYISWSVYPSSPEGITILDNEKLFDLTFNFRGGESSIAFDQTNCEVSDNNLETIDVTYFDGLMEGNSVLDVKVFLEGPYNSSDGEMNTGLNTNGAIPLNQPYNTSPWNYTGNETLDEIPDDMIDWVLIELRETSGNIYSATPDKTIAQYAAVLNKDGSVVSTTGNKISILELITENLYVIVRHRNHLDIMSSQPLDKVNGVYEYNFTTGTSKVFKGVQKNLGSFKYGMYAGDGTLDGNINFGDFVLYMMNQGATGYNYPDYNLDYTVNDPDRTMMIQNNGANQRIVE